MSKKKKQNVFTKLFDKSIDITTKDNSSYHIRKTRMYICNSNYYGKVYTVTSNKYNKDNVHIITEFYDSASDENRLRFRILNLHNAKKFKSIEKLPDGKERKIAIIESFDDSSEYICSIGNIKNIKSDTEVPKTKFDLENIKILQLILPKDYFNREENKKEAA